jgi:hypothetical protein
LVIIHAAREVTLSVCSTLVNVFLTSLTLPALRTSAHVLLITRGALRASSAILARVACAIVLVFTALENTVFPAKGNPSSCASTVKSIGCTVAVRGTWVEVGAHSTLQGTTDARGGTILDNTLINVILTVLSEPLRNIHTIT